MHDRIVTPKPSPGTPPGLKSLGRDLRLDACRGIALWFIFLDHVPNNIGSWLTLRNYGFSDTTEVFMFVSGITCATAYGKAQQRQGWSSVVAHTLRRSWDIYAAFLLLILACAVMVYASGGGRFADESNTRVLFEQPGPTLAHALILQYRPVNSDVLPTFVVYHALFAPLLWLLLRAPNAALAASLMLYALVQIFGWNVPAWPKNDWFFNPLAWQVLFVFGAWWATGGSKLLWPLVKSRSILMLVVAYLLFSFVIALSWSIKPLEAMIPQTLSKMIYPVDKSDLDVLRFLHFLALAVLAARFVPRDWPGFEPHPRAWKPASAKDRVKMDRQAGDSGAAKPRWNLLKITMRGAIRCGENSLAIYCLGVLLALGGHMILANTSAGLSMQIAVSFGGIVIMIVVATLLTRIMVNSKQRPGLF